MFDDLFKIYIFLVLIPLMSLIYTRSVYNSTILHQLKGLNLNIYVFWICLKCCYQTQDAAHLLFFFLRYILKYTGRQTRSI